jgi:hypothetical protein
MATIRWPKPARELTLRVVVRNERSSLAIDEKSVSYKRLRQATAGSRQDALEIALPFGASAVQNLQRYIGLKTGLRHPAAP